MMTKKKVSEDRVIEMIRKAQGEKGLREFATEIGISPSYLCDIYKGTRLPGEKILQYFDVERTRRVVVEYYLVGK